MSTSSIPQPPDYPGAFGYLAEAVRGYLAGEYSREHLVKSHAEAEKIACPERVVTDHAGAEHIPDYCARCNADQRAKTAAVAS